MEKLIVFILSALILLIPGFARTGNDEGIEGREAFLPGNGASIRISFEHNKMQEGWTPMVLSMGEINYLLWMDETGRVSELREADNDFVEPVCFIDVTNKSLRKETEALHFDVYEQNNVRTRWRLSRGGTPGTAGTMTKKILFREKSGIDLCLGNLRLQLKHVAWDIKEFSPGLFHVQFHGPMMVGYQPVVYEKASGMIYSQHELDTRSILEKNRTQAIKAGKSAFGAIPPQERAALIALYNSTDGDHWYNNWGWKTPPLAADGFALPGTENTWCGIYFEEEHTTVQSIYLSENGLYGTLPQKLENLTNLKYLWLYSNKLSGSILSELGNLLNLQYLELSGNQFSGTIPLELGNLTNLQRLDFSWNQLSGSIPPELGNLASLQGLDLGGNQLSGSIPPELGNLASLQGLDLGGNQLSGSMPPELGNLTNLIGLNIIQNQLSGTIPLELGNLANLQLFWLNSNQLRGSIPSELGNLANLQTFWLNSNQLSGSIPSNLGNLTNLFENCGINLHWNALYAKDDILRSFLDSKQFGGNWESTQTSAPVNVTAAAVSSTSIDIHWTPITYTSDTGGYRAFYSTTLGGPYTYCGMTVDKLASSFTVTDLNPGVTYYFVVQTRTYPHVNNQNTVDSEFSTEVSAIPFQLILTSPNGGESWGLNTKRNIIWTYSGLSGNSNIRLELWKADKKLGNIVASFPIVNGNYDWTVGYYGPGIAPGGNDYKIKIITANGLYNDASNAAFSIIQPSLTLTSPHGSESLERGTQQNITWTSVGLTGNVKLLLFKDGVQVGVIARGIPITNGTYAWTVGRFSGGMASKGSNYTVKIRGEDNPFYSSGSGPFTIW